MNKTQNSILRGFLVVSAALAASLFVGCSATDAIRTDVTYTPIPEEGQAAFTYGSEKDILYSHEVTDPDTGVQTKTDIKVLASAPEYARTEREIAQAQANSANAQTALEAIRTLSPFVAPSSPAPPPVPPAVE